MAFRSFAFYIDDEDKILRELLKYEAAVEAEEDVDGPDLVNQMNGSWEFDPFRQEVAEMYEILKPGTVDQSSKVLIEILCWCWLVDVKAVNAVSKEDSYRCDIDFFLTAGEVNRLCGDFASLDLDRLAAVLLGGEPTRCFESAKVLADFLGFWRDLFLKALSEKKALCYFIGGR
ncbi:MAG: hypothetical protein JWM59_3240 [Verrucomicrobiales bacterium]|nr:hypothetical protein [Verrucomicrobiales bacterium]